MMIVFKMTGLYTCLCKGVFILIRKPGCFIQPPVHKQDKCFKN
jgi:hypothetical protein